MRDKKPGEISDDLRISLGMPVGPVSTFFPQKNLCRQSYFFIEQLFTELSFTFGYKAYLKNELSTFGCRTRTASRPPG